MRMIKQYGKYYENLFFIVLVTLIHGERLHLALWKNSTFSTFLSPFLFSHDSAQCAAEGTVKDICNCF